MEIHRYVPHPGRALHPHLHSIWEFRVDPGDGGYAGETILPKGIVDIIFDLGSAAYTVTRGATRLEASPQRVRLIGVQTSGFTALPAAGLHLFGISVRAELAASLLALPLSEATDAYVEGELVLDGADEVWERLCEAPHFASRCGVAIPWLTARLRPRRETPLLSHACRALGQSRARSAAETGVGRLAKSLYVSERHLRRLFLEQVGVSPARYLRLNRFVKSIHLLAGDDSLTRVALAAGYYDQAHFCHDFRDIAGITPSEYRQAMGPVPGHLFLA